MKTANGKYANATIYTDNVETTALTQIKELCDQPFAESSSIKIMPDVHAGAGCVIGFTVNLKDIIIPNIVGVDISCGVLTVKLGKVDINLETLDNIIRSYNAAKPIKEGV